MFLLPSAVHAGRLLAAQPGLSLGDSVLSIRWGTLFFGEKVRGGPYIVLAVAAAVVCVAIVVLAHSPLLTDEPGPRQRPGPVTSGAAQSPGQG